MRRPLGVRSGTLQAQEGRRARAQDAGPGRGRAVVTRGRLSVTWRVWRCLGRWWRSWRSVVAFSGAFTASRVEVNGCVHDATGIQNDIDGFTKIRSPTWTYTSCGRHICVWHTAPPKQHVFTVCAERDIAATWPGRAETSDTSWPSPALLRPHALRSTVVCVARRPTGTDRNCYDFTNMLSNMHFFVWPLCLWWCVCVLLCGVLVAFCVILQFHTHRCDSQE